MRFRSQVLIPVDRSPLNLAESVGCFFGSLISQRVRDLGFFFPFSLLLAARLFLLFPKQRSKHLDSKLLIKLE